MSKPMTVSKRWSPDVFGVGLAMLLASACSHRVMDKAPEERPFHAVRDDRPAPHSAYAPSMSAASGVGSPESKSLGTPDSQRRTPDAAQSTPVRLPQQLAGATEPLEDVEPATPVAPRAQPAEPRPVPVSSARESVPTNPAPTVKQSPLQKALQSFLDDQPDEALKHLRQYEPRDQELLLRLLPVVARVERSSLAAARLGGENQTLLEVLRSIVADLRLSAPLAIHDLCFCKNVYGFGKREPLGHNQFRPGEVVKIYAELHNLSERRQEDMYVAAVACNLEIRGPDCKVKWKRDISTTLDPSSSPRTDHFLRFTLPIEPTLAPGFYTLRIQVVDQHTRRQAEQSIGFRVTSLATPQVN
jgi:hypothetical protein